MSQDCPPIEDLLAGETNAIEHARGCQRCRALLKLGEPVATSVDVPEVPHFPRAALPDRHPLPVRTPGEVVALRGEGPDGELMLAAVLVVSEGSLQVAPLSDEVGSASEWDLLLDAEEGPLGYSAIAEVWNHGRVSPSQVAESFGALGEDQSGQLLCLHAEVFGGEVPEGLPTGAPILTEEDPRSVFQEREAGRARCFWSDAREVSEEAVEEVAAGIGNWVGHWMEEVGTDAADLATEAGWMVGDLERLLREEVDPRKSAFAPNPMGGLLALTSIDPEDADARLRVTLAAQVEAASGASPAAFRAVFHRASAEVERRLDLRRSAAALETYIAEVIGVLEERRG